MSGKATTRAAVPRFSEVQAFSTDAGSGVRERLSALLVGYDWRRLPHRVAATVRSDLGRMAWLDEDADPSFAFTYGVGNGTDFETGSLDELHAIRRQLPDPIYRGRLSFFHVTKEAKQGTTTLKAARLDPGYFEFFCDVLVGSLGLYRRRDGVVELWRRLGRRVDRIEDVDSFYGVSKPVVGVADLILDAMALFPSLAPMRVTSGLAVGDTLHGGLGYEDLDAATIPKYIIGGADIDRRKAKGFLDLVCPEEASQHNLMLATVYPYYKRGNEKFFILKGPGGNGKSTYMEHFRSLIGAKFGVIDMVGLASTGFERMSATSRIRGKLVVQAPETDLESPRFVDGLKRIASGDFLVGRTISHDSFEFKCEAVLYLDTNTIVGLEMTNAMKRRLVGIMFVNRLLTWDEVKDYKEWLSTPEGAASLFTVCYEYFQDECEGRFSWNEVDVNEGEGFSSGVEEGIEELMLSALGSGPDKAFVESSRIASKSQGEKTRAMRHYGIKSIAKRIGGKVMRVWVVEDAELFRRRMVQAGFDMQDGKTGDAA
jgi:hypothetical protein